MIAEINSINGLDVKEIFQIMGQKGRIFEKKSKTGGTKSIYYGFQKEKAEKMKGRNNQLI